MSVYVIKRFGVSISNPAIIQTNTNNISFFSKPSPQTFTNQDEVQGSLPAAEAATADGWGLLGQRAMASQLLVASRNGYTNSGMQAVLSGDITIPVSALNATVNFILNENYFSITNQTISTVSDPMATLPSPLSRSPGTYTWSMSLALTGGNHLIGCGGQIMIDGISTFVSAFSNQPLFDPHIQLSLGVVFGGTVSGADQFQCRLMQFELQQ